MTVYYHGEDYEEHETLASLIAPEDDFDRVKCESCGAVIYKDDAVRLSNGDWLCLRDAMEVGAMEEGKI